MDAWIPKSNVGKFEAKMERLVKKAAKLKLPAPTYRVTGDVEVRDILVSENGHTAKVTHVRVEAEGDFPKLPGWNLIAVITHERYVDYDNEETWNRVDIVPGYEVSKGLRTAKPDCDHCKSNRYRKVTYLLENEQGTYRKQVGSTCVEDFLGGKSPEHILNQAKWLTLFKDIFADDELYSMGSYEPEFPLDEVLAFTNVVIEKHGWLSKSKAEEYGGFPTAEFAFEHIVLGSFHNTHDLRRVTQTDKDVAKAAIEWMLSHDFNEAEDYIYGCMLLCKAKWIRAKEMGLACSILGSYLNHLRFEAEKERKAKMKPSEHVGNIGDRATFEATFTWEYIGDSSWGTYAIMKFVTDEGNLLVWKSGPVADLERGDRVKLVGTIKKHDEFRGEKQTDLTRCKLEVL